MSALYLSIGVSLIIAIGFLVAFLWAMKHGQYDDDYTPSVRMLFEDAPASDNRIEKHSNKTETFCNSYKKSQDQSSTKKLWK